MYKSQQGDDCRRRGGECITLTYGLQRLLKVPAAAKHDCAVIRVETPFDARSPNHVAVTPLRGHELAPQRVDICQYRARCVQSRVKLQRTFRLAFGGAIVRGVLQVGLNPVAGSDPAASTRELRIERECSAQQLS